MAASELVYAKGGFPAAWLELTVLAVDLIGWEH
jgi:hypothetical protein